MSSRHASRTSCGWPDSLATLVRALTIAGMWFCPLAAPGWAADDRPANESWAFGSAAMELTRLPTTKADSDSSTGREVGVIAENSSIQPVSLNAVDSSHLPDRWDDFGTRLYLGYDRGFVIAADQGIRGDVASVDFLMRVNSWVQIRQTLFESDGPNPDQNTFSFERLRFSFSGHVLSPDLKYFFQFDGNSDRASAIFLDYFVTYDVGRNVFGLDKNKLGFKLGKWKVPFSRSREESGRLLQFTDRATANVVFDLNRSIGVALTSNLDPSDWLGPAAGPVQFETAIFNGFKTGNTSTNRGSGLDRNFGWSLRGHTDLLSDFGNDGEPDLSWHCEPALRVGGGLAFTRVDVEGSSEFNRQRVVDSGARLSSLLAVLPTSVTAYDVWFYTIDSHFKYHGLSIIAEYYWRHISRFNGAAIPSLLDDGFVLQTGYFVIAEKLELIARWSRIAGDSGTLGVVNKSSDEFGAGFVWYFKGHNAKLTFDASHFNGVPVSSSRLDLLPGDAGLLFRTQFQLAF